MFALGVWRRLLLGAGAIALTVVAAFKFGAARPPRASSTEHGVSAADSRTADATPPSKDAQGPEWIRSTVPTLLS